MSKLRRTRLSKLLHVLLILVLSIRTSVSELLHVCVKRKRRRQASTPDLCVHQPFLQLIRTSMSKLLHVFEEDRHLHQICVWQEGEDTPLLLLLLQVHAYCCVCQVSLCVYVGWCVMLVPCMYVCERCTHMFTIRKKRERRERKLREGETDRQTDRKTERERAREREKERERER